MRIVTYIPSSLLVFSASRIPDEKRQEVLRFYEEDPSRTIIEIVEHSGVSSNGVYRIVKEKYPNAFPPNKITQDQKLQVLRLRHMRPELRYRDIANIVGISEDNVSKILKSFGERSKRIYEITDSKANYIIRTFPGVLESAASFEDAVLDMAMLADISEKSMRSFIKRRGITEDNPSGIRYRDISYDDLAGVAEELAAGGTIADAARKRGVNPVVLIKKIRKFAPGVMKDNSHNRFTKLEIEKMRDRLLNGDSVGSVAEDIGVSEKSISYHVRSMMGEDWWAENITSRAWVSPLSELDKNMIVKRYEEGWPFSYIFSTLKDRWKDAGNGNMAVRRVLEDAGINVEIDQRSRKIHPAFWKNIVERKVSGETIAAIASDYGVDKAVIARILHIKGVISRPSLQHLEVDPSPYSGHAADLDKKIKPGVMPSWERPKSKPPDKEPFGETWFQRSERLKNIKKLQDSDDWDFTNPKDGALKEESIEDRLKRIKRERGVYI